MLEQGGGRRQAIWLKLLEKETPRTLRLCREAVRRAREGIPEQLKVSVYKYLCVFTPGLASRCEQSARSQIRLDLSRTFGQEKPSRPLIESFERVLVSVAHHYPDVGYCQGMNFWVFRLVAAFGEDHGWRIAYNLLRMPSLRAPYSDTSHLRLLNHVLAGLLSDLDRALSNRLDQLGVQLVFFTTSWFMTLFAKVLSKRAFLRLLDCLLFQGTKVLFRAALALMAFRRESVFSCEDGEETATLLQSDCPLSADELSQLMFSFSFSRERVQSLQAQWRMAQL